ncbi:MAG TPA: FGGY family carbohydrate kinase, partial [Herpetosiphonaceae bacterium]
MAGHPAPLILTLDIGSSSTRAMLFDASGAAVAGAAAQVKYELATSADGGSELDAERMLLRVAACLDELLHEAGALAGQIGAVALDTFVGNVLGVNGDGQAVTPVYTWADTRAAPWAAELRRQLDGAAVWQRTGCPLHSSYLPARLAWLAAERPRLFGAARRWLSFGEFVLERFCGRGRLSTSVASWGGLLDRRALAWDAELLAALPIEAGQLGEPVDASESIEGLAPEFAPRWPALRAVPWFPAIGDGVGSNLGCGAAGPERVALNLGTSGALRVVAGAVERVPEGLWCYRVDARRSLLGGSISNAGNLFAWLRETLRLPDQELFEAQLAAAEPAGHGLV